MISDSFHDDLNTVIELFSIDWVVNENAEVVNLIAQKNSLQNSLKRL